MKNAHRVLVAKPEGMRPRHRLDGDIKIYVRERERESI
jgi:hypothetical protein